ncbi:hypothetical protein [Bacteroidetes bacterium endosymbiont of Geopemphigus sp.]|uniref:hypothetical protein n=1 Tax=Bacteroidetes bacterium endosymbiont of Geopemphigus sp. TaxID=2047937 RepID=UPI000CD21804|nr:hypothetical protein [Bacteroidetes bacterium endosymbiont of Geopemphigus sp.]
MADQDGAYKLTYRVRLKNNPFERAFDGTTGGFGNGWVFYDSNADQIVYLRKGDKLHVCYYTYGTNGMNSNTNNIYIEKIIVI